MDEIVKQAMLKWPNVPDVHGWLRLDRRGNWLLQVRPGCFEPIGNRGLVEFIGRNYQHDNRQRWYFQNGPQRVFVGLDYTPWIFRMNDDRTGWQTQCNEHAGTLLEMLFDEEDSVILVTDRGPGLVHDRDLQALVDSLRIENGNTMDDETLTELPSGCRVHIPGGLVTVGKSSRQAIIERFGISVEPAAPTD